MSTATEPLPLPARTAVRGLVEDLVGRSVELGDGLPVAPGPGSVVGVYTTDRLGLAAVVVLDLAGAARLGGALGMLPRGGVDDAVDARDLPGMLRENCSEVLNVLASAFDLPGAPHVRLYQLHGPGDPAPADVAALAASPGQRLDVVLTVAGYGDARVSVVVR